MSGTITGTRAGTTSKRVCCSEHEGRKAGEHETGCLECVIAYPNNITVCSRAFPWQGRPLCVPCGSCTCAGDCAGVYPLANSRAERLTSLTGACGRIAGSLSLFLSTVHRAPRVGVWAQGGVCGTRHKESRKCKWTESTDLLLLSASRATSTRGVVHRCIV